MSSPLVTVLMSVYNGEQYLKKSIESILNQTYTNFEFIIINDGSQDKSLPIIKSYSNDSRINIIDQKNTGLSKALNHGATMAKGKYIARMDADDISLPNRIKLQVDFMERNPEYVIVGSNAVLMDMKGNQIGVTHYKITNEDIRQVLPESPFIHSSTMFRAEVFRACEGYNEKIIHHFEDKILWNKMSRYGKMFNISEPLIFYRLVPDSISNRKSSKFKVFQEISARIIETEIVADSDLEKIKEIVGSQTYKEKLANYYLRVGKLYIENNFNRKKAIGTLIQCIKIEPFNKIAWFNILLCLFPRGVIAYWKSTRNIIINGNTK